MLPAIYGDSYQIVQGQGFVGDPHRDDSRDAHHPARQPAARQQGHRASTWATRAATGKATRSSSRRRTSATAASIATAIPKTLQLVERFTPHVARRRSSGRSRSTIRRRGRGPWTFSMPLTMNDAEPLYEYACHEGNYAITEHPERIARRGRRRREDQKLTKSRSHREHRGFFSFKRILCGLCASVATYVIRRVSPLSDPASRAGRRTPRGCSSP